MKNRYEILEANTIIELEDEFGNTHEIQVPEKVVVIYANGYHKKDWKILIELKDLKKVDDAVDGSWYVGVSKGTIYARYCRNNNKKREYIFMHRIITDCPADFVVDHHPHHYGLDNRSCNLTTTTALENNRNQIKSKRLNNTYFAS